MSNQSGSSSDPDPYGRDPVFQISWESWNVATPPTPLRDQEIVNSVSSLCGTVEMDSVGENSTLICDQLRMRQREHSTHVM